MRLEKFVLDGKTGLRITTLWGVRIHLTAEEVRTLCVELPDLYPEHFPALAAVEVAGTTSEDRGL